MMGWLKGRLAAAEEIIWPAGRFCLGCGCIVGGRPLCTECEQTLAEERIRGKQPMPGVYSALWYDGFASRLVQDLKFRCVADCADALVPAMAETAAEMHLPPDVVLAWVPMPRSRRMERGIDHCRVLCEAFARHTGLPMLPLLRRTEKESTPQRNLNRQQRLEAIKGAFRAEGCQGMQVLLIDDVCTTGATVDACRGALLRGGAKRVWALTATARRDLSESE